jgi:hypothetical protein
VPSYAFVNGVEIPPPVGQSRISTGRTMCDALTPDTPFTTMTEADRPRTVEPSRAASRAKEPIT